MCERERESERKHTAGITATVDAARYFWRQVDMSFTCTDCRLLAAWRKRGSRERGEHGAAHQVHNNSVPLADDSTIRRCTSRRSHVKVSVVVLSLSICIIK